MIDINKLHEARIRARESGFTLVELAIVLVIIGLIIGGVLVGQDLIKAAEIRATVSQIESFNAAVNTFRGRYNGIPGDIRNVENFFDAGAGNTWPNLINGDGDRLLEPCDTIAATGLCDLTVTPSYIALAAAATHSGELLQFWHHLSAAELIPGFYDGVAFGGSGGTVGDSGTTGFSYPASKMDRNGITAFGSAGRNYYQIGAIANMTDELLLVDPSLTPEEAFNLDTKMDDGKPGTGAVIVRSSAGGLQEPDSITAITAGAPLLAGDGDFTASATATACVNEDVEGAADPDAAFRTANYALLNTNIACTVRLRMN